jgi:hypothetical protein
MRLSNEAEPDEYCSVIDEKDKILSNAAPTAATKTPQFPNSSAKCQACGMFNHTRKFCAFKNHELANRTTHQWDYSPRGKLWATHHKPCLTIGYALPGHQSIQHSDRNYPKPNPYAKSNSQTNSSNGKYRQYNNNGEIPFSSRKKTTGWSSAIGNRMVALTVETKWSRQLQQES